MLHLWGVTLMGGDRTAIKRYIKKIYLNFVLKNELSVSGIDAKIKDPRKRKEIFREAINEGNKLISELK